MIIQELLQLLKDEVERMRKEGRAYGKMAGLSDLDCAPEDVPSDKLCYSYSASSYALCAKGLEDIIKRVEKDNCYSTTISSTISS